VTSVLRTRPFLRRSIAAAAVSTLSLAGCGRVGSVPQPQAIQPSATDGAVLPRLVASAIEIRFGAASDTAGLAHLARVIGDARIVMLGEPWHGDGGAIRLRAELVRYLHERLGFDVLAFEADFYSLNRGWPEVRRTGEVGRFAAENVYPFWITSRAAQPLWAYVDSQLRGPRPLQVTGFDTRHVGQLARRTLPSELGQRLSEIAAVTAEERSRFMSVLERFLADEWRRPTAEEQRDFFSALDRLERRLSEDQSADPFWTQEVKNLRNAALYGWRGANRDRAMGENFVWVATKLYPSQKIIVWAHNNHIITDKWMYFEAPDSAIRAGLSRRSQETVGRFTYFGDEVKQFFGSRVYAIPTLSHTGTYSPDIRTVVVGERGNFDSLRVLAPTPDGTLEASLAAAGHEVAFIDLRPLRGARGPVRARALDYAISAPFAMRYWQGYDGFLFLRRTFGLNEPPPPDWLRGR
jgi:erythromycin esterase-like protein